MRTNLALFFISALLVAGLARAAEESSEAAADPARQAAAEKKPEPQITVKGAQGEEATKARLRADAMLARCVIKPVMTDEEIQVCKEAYRQTK